RLVVLVDVYRDAELPPQHLGDADVIGVAVREDDGRDVGLGTAELGAAARELAPVARRAGVDDGDAAALVGKQVPVDVRAPEPDDVVTEFHPGCLPRSLSATRAAL